MGKSALPINSLGFLSSAPIVYLIGFGDPGCECFEVRVSMIGVGRSMTLARSQRLVPVDLDHVLVSTSWITELYVAVIIFAWMGFFSGANA